MPRMQKQRTCRNRFTCWRFFARCTRMWRLWEHVDLFREGLEDYQGTYPEKRENLFGLYLPDLQSCFVYRNGPGCVSIPRRDPGMRQLRNNLLLCPPADRSHTRLAKGFIFKRHFRPGRSRWLCFSVNILAYQGANKKSQLVISCTGKGHKKRFNLTGGHRKKKTAQGLARCAGSRSRKEEGRQG